MTAKSQSVILRPESLPTNLEKLHKYVLINKAALGCFQETLKSISKLEDAEDLKEKTFKEG